MSATQPKLDYACTSQCSFRPEVIGPGAAAALLAIRASGAGARVFSKRASEILGRPVNQSSVQRHLKHYRELEPIEEAQEETMQAGGKVTDLEILDRIISAGARNAKNWKPTIGDTLKAMEMKLRLTGNSAFEDMLAAMAAASVDDDEEGGAESSLEAPESRFSEDERPAEEEEPVAEPVF